MELQISSSTFQSHPATQLNFDILWSIFNIITDSSFSDDDLDEEPLLVIRRASQVCHDWREMLLQTPSIWARLIRGNSMDQVEDHWRNEVLKRSGSSPLWVKAGYGRPGSDINFAEKNLQKYFGALIKRNWYRIERLNLRLGLMPLPDLWSSICHNAPRLESLHLSGISAGLDLSTTIPIFMNCAPRLQEFRFALDTVPLDLQVSWMSPLQVLELSFATVHMVFQFLHIAGTSTSRLRSLSLHLVSVERVHFPLLKHLFPPARKLQFPHLTTLSLRGQRLVAPLLECISAPAECSLEVQLDLVETDGGTPISNLQTDLQRILSTHGAKYLLANPLTRATLMLGCGLFAFSGMSSSTKLSDNFVMSCQIPSGSQGFNSHFRLPSLLGAIPPNAFSSVKELELHVPQDRSCFFDLQESAPFFASLHAVETLIIPTETIHILKALPRNFKAFPSIHTVKLRGRSRSSNSIVPMLFSETSAVLMSFREWRQKAHLPDIKVFNLTYEKPYDEVFLRPDLRVLAAAGMHGVKIRHGDRGKVKEYIVGDISYGV